MTGISEIEVAVAKLSRQDLSTFCDWFQEFDADAWDRQTDYSAWAQRHAELLRARRYAELDLEHLLEELSDMSRSERRELESRLLILLAHL